jgi:hypothetical protein
MCDAGGVGIRMVSGGFEGGLPGLAVGLYTTYVESDKRVRKRGGNLRMPVRRTSSKRRKAREESRSDISRSR